MTDDPKGRPADDFAPGLMDDGKLNVVTPEEHARRVIERDADEAEDEEEDFADLAGAASDDD